jgi:hypothetical protein
MIAIALICCIALLLGAFAGKQLAKRGIQADTVFEKQQGMLLSGIIAIAAVIFSLVAIDRFNLVGSTQHLIPTWVRLYFAEYITDLIFVAGCFVLGLLVAMELSQKKSPSQIRQLLIAIGAIAFAFTILLHYSLPITGAIGKAKVVNGVVLQTTSFTCAPASIATLARFVGKHPNISERDVTELTHTNRFGTSTLAEIRAMQQLGLQPKYEDGLNINHLVKTNRLALLHVRENYQGQYINHAVALLKTDTKKQIVIIANPLYGLQTKTFKEMENYWLGEAIFVLY